MRSTDAVPKSLPVTSASRRCAPALSSGHVSGISHRRRTGLSAVPRPKYIHSALVPNSDPFRSLNIHSQWHVNPQVMRLARYSDSSVRKPTIRVIILSCGVGTLVSGCRLPGRPAGIGRTGWPRRGLGRLADREVAVKDFLPSARAPQEHLDLVIGSPELIRRATVHPDRTELPGKHRRQAARRRSAPAAGIRPEISFLRVLYQVSRAQGKSACLRHFLQTTRR